MQPRLRLFSAVPAVSEATALEAESEAESQSQSQCEEPELMHPHALMPVIPYPAALSPSSIAEFMHCPQSFLFQYLYGLKQPTSLALLKGRLVHAALEQLYDLPAQQRTESTLHNLFRTLYQAQRQDHAFLFPNEEDTTTINHTTSTNTNTTTHPPPNIHAERAWGHEALALLSTYWHTEDAKRVQPAQREVWVRAQIPILQQPLSSSSSEPKNETETGETKTKTHFLVRGIVDRLDLNQVVVRSSSSNREKQEEEIDPTVLRVVDYKTSKQPNLKYSKEMNAHIRDKTWFQLEIYALLLFEQQQAWKAKHNKDTIDENTTASSSSSSSSLSLPVRFLQLMYLNSDHTKADCWTLDLGSSAAQRQAKIDATRTQLQNVYADMCALIDTQDPTAFVGCKRSFCYCHVCRAKFLPETVWSPPSSTK